MPTTSAAKSAPLTKCSGSEKLSSGHECEQGAHSKTSGASRLTNFFASESSRRWRARLEQVLSIKYLDLNDIYSLLSIPAPRHSSLQGPVLQEAIGTEPSCPAAADCSPRTAICRTRRGMSGLGSSPYNARFLPIQCTGSYPYNAIWAVAS